MRRRPSPFAAISAPLLVLILVASMQLWAVETANAGRQLH